MWNRAPEVVSRRKRNTFVTRQIREQAALAAFRTTIILSMLRVDPTKAFVSLNAIAALGCFAAAIAHPAVIRGKGEFLCYLAVVLLTSTLKVTLPGIDGTLSLSFIFLFLGMLEMTYAETLVLGVASVFVQSYWHSSKRLKPIQVIFNLSQLTVATAAAYCVFQFLSSHSLREQRALALACAAIVYFLFNTCAMATVISLADRKSMRQVWIEGYLWSFPYYLIGAAIAGFVSYLNRQIGWQAALLTLPVVYVIYRSYRLYVGKLEDGKIHAEEMSHLHLRTIEALALAIEAKDHNTHEHLQRVRVYAMEIAKELRLTHPEMEALQAASLLHDIGKLAVPEHIISKPGKLTPEEFEKMKIHPIVGAEILEQVRFPYPVVPIVHSHHEKWDGSGYPRGLRGEEIPIGARILAAVDCLDALASHRQYRPALPLDLAMAKVAAESGKSFDPQVVKILQERYVELEKLAHEKEEDRPQLSVDVKVERGLAPAAGFERQPEPAMQPVDEDHDTLSSIAAARQEAQSLFEMGHDLGAALRLDDTLSMFSVRLRRFVAYDAMVVYVRHGDLLTAEYVSGDNFRLFSSLKIPVGAGLSGWVAHNNKPIMNGNPAVEPGYVNDPARFTNLRSALAVPLQGDANVVAVLALYRTGQDAFTQDQLRIVQSAGSKLGITIENALKVRKAEDSATTDSLTGLPNARSLYRHLEAELARCRRSNDPLTVLVLDLNGFKQVNDRFGQIEGNNLLRTFATALKESCREYDYAARIGGDEFVIVAPGMPPEAVAEIGERWQKIAADVASAICPAHVLSLSVGKATYPDDGGDAETLLAAADRSLYAMKRSRPGMARAQAAK
jgi:diguanylate cyclase (GGDEF)-like protein/putative nucleotidyltransferase with HDIG domain